MYIFALIFVQYVAVIHHDSQVQFRTSLMASAGFNYFSYYIGLLTAHLLLDAALFLQGASGLVNQPECM